MLDRKRAEARGQKPEARSQRLVRLPASGFRHRSCHGFTLIELCIVITLLALFGGAVYESVIVGLRTANASDERENIRQQLANALDMLTREASLADVVDVAADQQFQFDADLDGDGTVENNINYQVSSGTFQRVYNGATLTLVRNLASLDFNYVDSAGSNMATTVPDQATRNTIRVMQVTTSATNDAETVSLANAAYLRNN